MKKYLGYFIFVFFFTMSALGGLFLFDNNVEKVNAYSVKNDSVSSNLETSHIDFENTIDYVSLGDSIASGYTIYPNSANAWNGWKESDEYGYNGKTTSTPIYDSTYADLFIDNTLKNSSYATNVNGVSYARSGDTTTDLLNKIQNDEAVRISIENADVITLSIGANDILQSMDSDLVFSIAMWMVNLDPNAGTNIANKLDSGVDTALANYPTIIDEINTLNPNAKVIVSSVYNPFEEFTTFSDTDFIYVNTFMGALKIVGEDVRKVGRAAAVAIDKLNKGIQTCISDEPNWSITELNVDGSNKAFDNWVTIEGNYDVIDCRLLDFKNDETKQNDITINNIYDYVDIHPTQLGHNLIYQTIASEFNNDYKFLKLDFGGKNVLGQSNSIKVVNSNGKLDSSIVDSIAQNSDGEMLIGLYKESTFVNKWNFENDTVTNNTTLYAKWAELTTTGELNQYKQNINYASEVTFDIGVASGVKWFVNNAEQTGKTTGTFKFKPSSFGKYEIYCIVDEFTSEVFELNAYYEPSSLIITKVNTGVNTYTFELDESADANLAYIDLNCIHWYCEKLVSGVPEVVSIGELSKKIDNCVVDDECKIYLSYVNLPWKDFKSNEFNIPYQYSVSYWVDDVEYAILPADKNSTILNKPENPTKANSIFGGWYKEIACVNKWDFNSDVVTGELNLYAKWVDVELKSGTLEQYVTNINNATEIELFVDAESSIKWFVNNAEQVGKTGKTFKFKPASFGEYKIWCEVDGAKSGEIISTYYCEPTSLSITYSNTGNDFIVSITSDITNVNKSKLYWHLQDEYGNEDGVYLDVLFDSVGSYSCGIEDVDRIFTIKLVYENTPLITSNIIEVIPQFTVTLNDNGTLQTVYEAKNSLLTKPSSVKGMNGKVFKGWYADENCTLLWDFATDRVVSNITLYSAYTDLEIEVRDGAGRNYYEIHIVNADLDYIETADLTWKITDENNNITTKANVNILNCDNISLCYEIELQYGETGATSNIVKIGPKYEVKYKVGLSVVDTKLVERAEKIANIPSNPTQTGKIFQAWYKESSCVTKWNFEVDTVLGDLSLYAKFVEIQYVEGELEQYVGKTSPVKFTINLDAEISWYVNSFRIQGENSNTFEFTPEKGVAGEFVISCVANGGSCEASEIIKTKFFVPTELNVNFVRTETSATKFFLFGENAESIDASKVVWYKVVRDEHIKIGEGLQVLTSTSGECDIYAVYDGNIKSESFHFEPDYTIAIITMITILSLFAGAAVVLVIRELSRNKKL